jgi:arginase
MAVQLIGAACSVGGRHRGCMDAPGVLMDSLHPALAGRMKQDASWKTTVRERAPEDGLSVVDAVADFCRRLRAAVGEALEDGEFPVVLGGDHSCAMGTWSAVAGRQGAFGMLWIDAHLDSHTPETTQSGALHGMPLACLLGHGPSSLTELYPGARAVLARHACLVGARSLEPGERELLMELGIPVFTMEDIRARGLSAVLCEAYERVSACPSGFGVSIDLDVFDPADAPGVSTPVPDGLRGEELLAALRALPPRRTPSALEIAEYNPFFDEEGRTAALVGRLVEEIAGRASALR